MIENHIKELLIHFGVHFEENKDVSRITWIKRGGVARFFVQPYSASELEKICIYFYKEQVPFDIMGASSNLYCKKSYNPFILVSTQKCNHISINETEILCECGANTSLLSQKCCEKKYSGFEGLTKLPGTIGGAVCNNASAFNCSLSNVLRNVRFIDCNGIVKNLTADQFYFTHRSSALKRKELQGVILSCSFKIIKSCDNLLEKARFYENERKNTQQGPLLNLGSCFIANKLRRLKRSDFKSILDYLHYTIFLGIYYLLRRFLSNPTKIYKEHILKILGYSDISKYVSDKNINCFVWLDDGADIAFVRYSEFMQKYNISPNYEIEIRD